MPRPLGAEKRTVGRTARDLDPDGNIVSITES